MTQTVIMTVIVLNRPNVANTVIAGMIKSRTAMSLENLVKILPNGFESKKRILERTTLSVIYSCILVVLTVYIKKIMTALAKVTST